MKPRPSSTLYFRTSFSSYLLIRFPETEKISPPLLQMSEVWFGYRTEETILKGINIDVGLDSRIAIVGANGAGKSTL
jgi:ATPase subunit of ABC transporter with duplicated ATPase domains